METVETQLSRSAIASATPEQRAAANEVQKFLFDPKLDFQTKLAQLTQLGEAKSLSREQMRVVVGVACQEKLKEAGFPESLNNTERQTLAVDMRALDQYYRDRRWGGFPHNDELQNRLSAAENTRKPTTQPATQPATTAEPTKVSVILPSAIVRQA